MSPHADLLAKCGFAPLERAFARTVLRLGDGTESAQLGLVAAAALHALRQGDLCYSLGDELWAGVDGDAGLSLPGETHVGRLRASLRASAAVRYVPVGEFGRELGRDAMDGRPLVLDSNDRVFLRRVFEAQLSVASALVARSHAEVPVDEAVLIAGLERRFGDDPSGADQRLAAELALRRRLTLISGGPGTGKTTTVAKILGLLAEQAEAAGSDPPRVALAAPTGKAAARLGQSLASSREPVGPAAPRTLHRLLGIAPGMRSRLPAGRLSHDVIVVDEASMVDLSLMEELLRAAPADARLILLGDPDQLSSVAEGAVFSDLCAAPGSTTVGRSHARLRVGHRYRADSALGILAEHVRAGEGSAALALLAAGSGGVALCPSSTRYALPPELIDRVVHGYGPAIEAGDPLERLGRLERYRVLTAHRRGPFGAPVVSDRVRAALLDRGLLQLVAGGVDFEPIFITRNDPALGLFNGDLGFVERRPSAPPAAHFLVDGALRTLSPSRLPSHESAWAMTVHKSQGSEMDEVALVLPETISAVCTRELVYTAITRAKRDVTVHAPPAVFAEAVGRRTRRRSALADALLALGD